MTTEVPGYVTKTDLLITGELPPGSSCGSATWPRSPKATPTPPPLGHICTSWARIR